MKNLKFNRLLMLLAAFLTMSINLWATDYNAVQTTFGSTIPTGWSVNPTSGHASGYLKFQTGSTISTTASKLFAEEVLATNMSVEVSCGTFGTWNGTKSVTVTTAFLDENDDVLTTANSTFSDLSSSESAYKSAINLSKPSDPKQIKKLLITFNGFTSGDVLRVKYVRLTYSTTVGTNYTDV